MRDKNDAIDAFRIAEYADSKKQQIKLWEPPRPIIRELKRLVALRKRLVDTKVRLRVPFNEEQGFCDDEWVRFHKKAIKPILDQTTSKIQELEQQIQMLIETDEVLKNLYELVTSVKGVGMIVGINTLVTTNEFKSINDPRKMACHCGVAPFTQQSGKSIRGRSKVSHRANKSMKSLYNLSARSAVSRKGELRDYYLRKVKEGKNKMTTMNAVRNKIIHRIFACVRDNRKYENTYVHNLA